MKNRLIPLYEVSAARRNQSKAGLYNDVNGGLLPRPIKLGRNSAWPENEIEAINRAIIAGKSDDEIRRLVKELEASRTTAGNEEIIDDTSDYQIRDLIKELRATRTSLDAFAVGTA